jgi:hypothetical protein
MPRVLTGRKDNIPEGLAPLEWAGEVFQLMDEGYSQNDAKVIVAGRYAKAEDQPAIDKMVKQSRNKGL